MAEENKPINVVNDYDWTSIPRGSGLRKNAPSVFVHVYRFKSSAALNRLTSYLKASFKSDPDEYYDSLYSDATEKEESYKFPYLSDGYRSFSNTFGDTYNSEFLSKVDSMMSGPLGELSELVAVVSNKPGSNVESPKLYQYEPNDGPLDINFILANTENADYMKNYGLVTRLTQMNRPRRTSFTFMEPPRIYKIKIPGIRFIRWAYCSSFNVRMLGAKREINGIIIPEGYDISMSFQSLTIEVANFLNHVK